MIAPPNVIAKKHKPTVIKIAKKIVQKNAIAKNKNVIANAKKTANVQKKNVIVAAKKAKNVHVNAAKIATATTENAAKRKNLNSLIKNVNVKKIAKKKQIAIVKNKI